MKVYINDKLGHEWAYDTDEQRFYLNDFEVEKELGVRNGYGCLPYKIRSLLIGNKAVVDFDRKRALNFLEIVKAITR